MPNKSFIIKDTLLISHTARFLLMHQQLPAPAAKYYKNALLYSFYKCIFVVIFW